MIIMMMKKSNILELLRIDNTYEELTPWFESEGKKVISYLKQLENKNIEYYPRRNNIFKALSLSLEKVNVVIVGQDPYSNPGYATGIAFAVPSYEWDRPSLKTIRDDLMLVYNRIDIDDPDVFDYTLQYWIDQGVLLLNTALTVQAFIPKSHKDLWKNFTKTLIEIINKRDNIIFVMMGKEAQYFSDLIDQERNILIEVDHPAKDSHSSKKYFTGSRVFERINNYLIELHKNPIEWLRPISNPRITNSTQNG